MVAGPLVDTATLRFQTGSLTDAEVMAVLREYDVRAVVADRAFLGRPALLEQLGSDTDCSTRTSRFACTWRDEVLEAGSETGMSDVPIARVGDGVPSPNAQRVPDVTEHSDTRVRSYEDFLKGRRPRTRST